MVLKQAKKSVNEMKQDEVNQITKTNNTGLPATTEGKIAYLYKHNKYFTETKLQDCFNNFLEFSNLKLEKTANGTYNIKILDEQTKKTLYTIPADSVENDKTSRLNVGSLANSMKTIEKYGSVDMKRETPSSELSKAIAKAQNQITFKALKFLQQKQLEQKNSSPYEKQVTSNTMKSIMSAKHLPFNSFIALDQDPEIKGLLRQVNSSIKNGKSLEETVKSVSAHPKRRMGLFGRAIYNVNKTAELVGTATIAVTNRSTLKKNAKEEKKWKKEHPGEKLPDFDENNTPFKSNNENLQPYLKNVNYELEQHGVPFKCGDKIKYHSPKTGQTLEYTINYFDKKTNKVVATRNDQEGTKVNFNIKTLQDLRKKQKTYNNENTK